MNFIFSISKKMPRPFDTIKKELRGKLKMQVNAVSKIFLDKEIMKTEFRDSLIHNENKLFNILIHEINECELALVVYRCGISHLRIKPSALHYATVHALNEKNKNKFIPY